MPETVLRPVVLTAVPLVVLRVSIIVARLEAVPNACLPVVVDLTPAVVPVAVLRTDPLFKPADFVATLRPYAPARLVLRP